MLKFFAEKMWVAFAFAKATHIFSAKNIRILYIESAKKVNETTFNELVKLTTLWTTGLRKIYQNIICWYEAADGLVVNGRVVSTPNRIMKSQVWIPLKAEFTSWLYGASLHSAFHDRPSVILISPK